MFARTLSIILGVWLFISAFIWPHSDAQRTNTWIMGLLCVVFAMAALRMPEVRFANTVLAIWLFISAFALPALSAATVWNNALVAIAIFIASLVPNVMEEERFTRRPMLPTRRPQSV
jgi:hypothetical protein